MKNKIFKKALSVFTAMAMMVSVVIGNNVTAYAKAVGIKNTPEITSSGGVEMYYMHGYDTYIVDGTNPNTTAVYYFENNDANSGNRIYVNPNGAAGDDLSASWIWSNGSTYELSGDMNIEMTGGSVNSIATGYNIYGSGNDKTNVNINISGGSCGSVRKLTDEYSEKVWLFSEQKVPELQNLTGYITKTDSGWVAHGDAIIPEGKTVTVGEGEVFQIESGATLTNNGTIVNNGTINTSVPLNVTVTGNGTINRNTAYISGISSVSSISVKMDDADYALANGYYETADGKLYLWLPSGYAVVFVDGSIYCGMANEGTAVELLAYKAVADIETIPSRISVGINYNLEGYAVTNNDATYKTIEWSVLNANGTGATITDNVIKATSEGTATIRATVRNGQAYGEDYHKDYTIEFCETYEISVANGSITISKKDENTVTITGGEFAEAKEYSMGEYITIIGTTDSNTITISEGTTANVILSNVSISSSKTPIDIQSGATLNLTLLGENTLTSNNNAALHVPAGAKLVITDESTGSLNATGGSIAAGIGGNYEENSGDVEIHGGTITAKMQFGLSNHSGAGIGGGYAGSNGSVTITGGYVNASATNGGAGIGAGYGWSRNGGKVTITGGTVIVSGKGQNNCHGAGIGGGHNNGDGGTVVITGGNVQAIAGNGAEAIGKGNGSGSSGTLKDSAGNDISLIEITLDGVSDKTSVTNIVIDGSTYGSKDVVTIGDKLYLYLPVGTKPTSVTAGGYTYVCYSNGQMYKNHSDWVEATCTSAKHCSRCGLTEGEALPHSYVNGVCNVCGMDENGVFHIKTAEQLVAFAQYVNAGNKDANAELDANIVMTDVDWTPICQTVSFHDTAATDTGYTGTFDGQGHTISNLTVTFNPDTSKTYSHGLFGTVSGTVKNLGMVNFNYENTTGDTRAGSIVGQVISGATITNCYSVGHSITTSNNIAGGIAGCNYGGTISNCYALNGSVSGYDTRWGGVVGDSKKDDSAPDQAQTYGTVSNCYTDDTRVVSSQNDNGSITSCAVKDDAAFASGEIAYLLNGSSSENVTWYQTLETDTYPVLNREHGKVYSVFKCDGTTPVYRNVNENEPHTDNNSDGECDVCGGNAHIHEWTYTASNNTITAECGAADCPATGTNTIVISASGKTYDGTAVTATVENNVDGTDYSSSIVYRDSRGAEVNEAVNAGTYTANLTLTSADSTEVTASVEFTIDEKAITVTADDKSKTYGEDDPTFTYTATGLEVNDTLTGTLVRAEGEDVGTYAITQGTLTNENNPNYDITFVEGTFTINKATPPALTIPTATAITYGDTLSSSVLSDSSWAWVDGTIIPNTTNHNAYIEVDDSNYDYTSVYGYDSANHRVVRDITVIINRATLTITANSYTIKVGSALPTYDYTVTGLVGNDTLPVDVTISCSATDSNAVGAYTITISGVVSDAPLASHYVINYVNGKLTITEKDIQEIAADDVILTYGETKNIGATTNGDGAITYSTTSDVISVAADGTITANKAGTATVTITAAETADYAEATKTVTVTVNKKKVAVPTADTTEYTYTGTAQTYGVTSTDDYTVEGGVQTNAGEYPITITLNNENYEWDGTLGTYKFVINKAAVTVTAKSYSIKVGEALPTYAYDVAGLVNGETLPIDVTISCNAADSNTAGTYTITVSGAANSTNYTFAYVNGTLTISNKLEQTITASNVTLTYGETGKKITATTSGDGAISYSTTSDVISVAADGTITALKAGTTTVTINVAETDTYAAATKTVTVTVNKAAVTVTAKSYSIKVGEALPTYAYDVAGLVNGETLPIDVTISCNVADSNTAGTYDIIVSGAATSDNYTFSYVKGTLTVSEKEVVAAPTFTPASGTTFTSSQKVTISCATAGAKIYYTTDGTEPTTASTLYNGAFTITTTTTIKAIAVKDGMTDSAVVTATYTKKSSGGGGGGGGYTPSRPSTPNNPEIGGKSASWATIASDISKLPIGSEITIELNGNYDVPLIVIKAIADREVKVTFVVDSTRNWYVDGAEIETPTAADLSIIYIGSLKADGVRGDVGTKFRIDGTNIPTELVVALDKKHAGKFANLYKKKENELVFVDNIKVDENGKVILPVSEQGDYVIMLCEFSDRKGDVSNDGVTNALDASAILKDIVELAEAANPVMLDYNGDGKVNALDASAILKDIVNGKI